MEKDTENSVNTDKKLKSHLFQEGEDPRRNLNGRPKGTENFSTKWFKLIDKLAKQNDIDADEVEQQLLMIGYKKAKDGDYRFYQDVFDRIYGKPTQTTELTGKDGKDLIPETLTDEEKIKLKELFGKSHK